MPSIPTPADSALPSGSLVVVTGVTAFVGAHVANQVLERGFRVRGLVRDVRMAAWLEERFGSEYGRGTYEVAHVPDLSVWGALNESMQDVSEQLLLFYELC